MTIQNLTTNSNSAHQRIINAFPNVTKWSNYELVLSTLISFFEGEKIRINDGWKQSRGHSSLCANAEGRNVLTLSAYARMQPLLNSSVNF